jgi:hypothetical protein
MRNIPQHPGNVAVKHCAICNGQFGLIRHYAWQKAVCSKKCADRFRARREDDRKWLRRLQAAA